MKKTLCLTVLILASVSAYAVECTSPEVCTLWAHQMCTANQRFFGEDECLECGCPKDEYGNQGTATTKDGETACCFNNMSWDNTNYTYSGENAKVCGCPKDKDGNQGTKTTKDGETACCFNNNAWDGYGQTYSKENAKVCGCPRDAAGNQGTKTTKDGETACCFHNYAWDSYEQAYSGENAKVCGCPRDAAGNQGTKTTQDGQTACCFNNKSWYSPFETYSGENAKVCGCPRDKNGNQGMVTAKDGQTACCFHNYAWDSYGQIYTEENAKVCGCPRDKDGNQGTVTTQDGETVCCFNNKSWDSYELTYSEENAKVCGCPRDKDGNQGTVTTKDGQTACCKDSFGYDFYSNSYSKSTEVCCPETDLITGWTMGIIECRRHFTAQFENKYCRAPITVPGSKVCSTGKHRYEYSPTSAVLLCDNQKDCSEGVVVENEYKPYDCFCGCYNNDDCFSLLRIGRIQKRCQDNNTCALPKTLEFNGFKVRYTDFAGGQITEEKLKNAILHIKNELLATTNESNVTIKFDGINSDGYMNDANGYSLDGDKKEIHINSIDCQIINDQMLSCQGTIVHENIHRVDNINQPLWNALKSPLSRTYQLLLTEIRAQSEGTRVNIVTALSACYRNQNGTIVSVLAPGSIHNFSESEIKSCIGAIRRINSYGKNIDEFVNNEMAQKYFITDPDYFKAKNCNGLVAKLEKDFINSNYVRTEYFEDSYRQYRRSQDWAEEIKVIIQDQVRVAAQLGRTDWTWQNNQETLAEMVAQLYKNHANLCLTESEFLNNRNLTLGFDEINYKKVSEAYAVFKSNSDCMNCWNGEDNSEACRRCNEAIQCGLDANNTRCTPVSQFNNAIGHTNTLTL